MNRLKILIIEDESLIALELTQAIKALGYLNVEYTTTLNIAKKIIKSNKINLLIMDINLNAKQTGIQFYNSLKTTIPIIYITAYKDDQTISNAISTNPLGYLTKPINYDELNALLKLAKHKILNLPNSIKLDQNYIFYTDKEQLFCGEKFINLGKKELELLKLLLYANNNVVNFKTIEYTIWQDKIVSSSTIRTLIYRLRKKLGNQFIQTEFNYGVKLIKKS